MSAYANKKRQEQEDFVSPRKTRRAARANQSRLADSSSVSEPLDSSFCPIPGQAPTTAPKTTPASVESLGAAFGHYTDEPFEDVIAPREEAPLVRQSLIRGGAETYSDRDLTRGMSAERVDLGAMDPSGVEAADQERNLTILQWEASGRGVTEEPPPLDAATAVTLPGGIQLSASPAHLRFLVEDEIRREGHAHGLVRLLQEAIADKESAGVGLGDQGMPNPAAELAHWDEVEELRTVLAVLNGQVALVRESITMFSAQFKTRAHRTAWSILDESQRRVEAEMERYGMSGDKNWGFAAGRSTNALPETQAMRAAAKQMQTSKKDVDALHEKRGALVAGFGYPNVMSGMPTGESPPGNDTEKAALEAIEAEIDAAELGHVQLRMELEAEFPSLAQYKSAGDLKTVANHTSGPDQMAADLTDILANIAEARDALGSGELDAMTLPEVVGMTKQALMVREASMRSRIVGDLVSDAQPSGTRAIAIAAISIGLGLLAIPISGGASLSVGTSAALIAVEGVGLGIDAVLLSQSVSEYLVKKAASGTDPDKARALSQEDPSIGWLAAEILGTAVGAGAAIKTFRSLAAARRAALAANDALELEERLRELRQLGAGAGLSDNAQRRLVREVREKGLLRAETSLEDVRAWARALADSNPNKMTPEEVAADLDDYMNRREKVRELYDFAQTNPELLPGGITLEHLELAVKGDPETGMRVPLNYAVEGGEVVNDPAEAAALFAEFKAEVEVVFASHGIDDAVVVQLGSGTTGWSTAPGKNSVMPSDTNAAKTQEWAGSPDGTKTKPWGAGSDVDIAIFSDKSLKQAMEFDVPVNPKNQQAGQFTTLKNTRQGKSAGFYDTPLGKDLKALGARWDKKIYGETEEEMFDFKLNLQSDEPFISAVEIIGPKSSSKVGRNSK